MPFMARSLRLEFSGAFYHVMARGNRRERIFLDDADCRFFLQILGEGCTMTGRVPRHTSSTFVVGGGQI